MSCIPALFGEDIGRVDLARYMGHNGGTSNVIFVNFVIAQIDVFSFFICEGRCPAPGGLVIVVNHL